MSLRQLLQVWTWLDMGLVKLTVNFTVPNSSRTVAFCDPPEGLRHVRSASVCTVCDLHRCESGLADEYVVDDELTSQLSSRSTAQCETEIGHLPACC